jgi:hypothetical protein
MMGEHISVRRIGRWVKPFAWAGNPSHILLMALLGMGIIGCTPRVIAPVGVNHPVEIIIADYGRHTSLLIPAQTTGFVEFAWGDYAWFVENRTGSGSAMEALFWSRGSALGMREYKSELTDQALIKSSGASRLLHLQTPADKTFALRDQLIGAIRSRWSEHVFNKANEMDFVRDGPHYWFAHNCNHVTAGWLRELGCRVEGCVLFSDFELKQ